MYIFLFWFGHRISKRRFFLRKMRLLTLALITVILLNSMIRLHLRTLLTAILLNSMIRLHLRTLLENLNPSKKGFAQSFKSWFGISSNFHTNSKSWSNDKLTQIARKTTNTYFFGKYVLQTSPTLLLPPRCLFN